MALVAILGIGALAALLKQNSPSKGYYEYIKSGFASSHDLYPKGVRPNMLIEGQSVPNLKQMGNPERKNPMRELLVYPNFEVSRLIDKKKKNWKKVYSKVLNKEKQLDLLEDKWMKEDPLFLTPDYKQRNTRVSLPKLTGLKGC
jgi:hypothetical protein